MNTKAGAESASMLRPEAGRRIVRITPERITGVVLDAYAPLRTQLRRLVAALVRGLGGLPWGRRRSASGPGGAGH